MLLWLNESEATLARFNICCEEAGLSGWLNSIWQFRRLSQASNHIQFTEWLARCAEVRKDAGFEHTSVSCFHHFSVSTWKRTLMTGFSHHFLSSWEKTNVQTYQSFFLTFKAWVVWEWCHIDKWQISLNVIVCSDNSIQQHLQLWYESTSLWILFS